MALALTAGYVVGMQFGKVPPATDAADRSRHVPRRCRAYRVVEGFGFATLTVAAPKVIVAATVADVRRFALGA